MKNNYKKFIQGLNYLLLLCCALMFNLVSLAQSIVVDGNPSDWPAVLTSNSVIAKAFVVDPVNSSLDNQFTNGAQDVDLISGWGWEPGNANDKGDITNSGAVLIGDNLYFFGDRTAINGNAQIGFWFFLGDVAPLGTGKFSGAHQIGDLLVLSNFTNGGGTSYLKIYRWTASGIAFIDSVPNAKVNTTQYDVPSVPATWPYDPWSFKAKTGDLNKYITGSFFEGALSITKDLGGNICFQQFMLETRNSQSIHASLQDFVSGNFNIAPDCSITGLDEVCPANEFEYVAPENMDSYFWVVTGDASIKDEVDDQQTVTVVTDGKCGSFTLSLTLENAYGCTSECEKEVSIVDTEAPEITAKNGDNDLGCNPTEEDIDAALGSASATDNCYAEVIVSAEDGSVVEDGCMRSMTRTFTATDGCGNDAEEVTVTVTWKVDTEAPVITAGKGNDDLGCNPTKEDIDAALGSANATDNCDAEITVVAKDGSVVENGCLRSLTRTFTATDECGNDAEEVTVTVTWKVDTEAPVITAGKENDDLGCNPSADDIEAALGSASATDNCDAEITVVAKDGSVVEDGCLRSLTRTFTATDECGNDATPVTVTVTWKEDITKPEPETELVNLEFECYENVVLPDPKFKDNCDEGYLDYTCAITNSIESCDSYEFPLGDTEVSFTAKDACGNSNTVYITITVLPCKAEYCTYTQGFYGTQTGKACGDVLGTVFTKSLLLSKGDLVIGSLPNNRSLTFKASSDAEAIASAKLLAAILNSGGASYILKNNCTPYTDPTCVNQYLTKGKLNNSLLVQTITLGLNLRIATMDNLAALEIKSGYLTTQQKVSCDQGAALVQCNGTNNPYFAKMLPASVVNNLTDKTVLGLYNYANSLLGGQISLTPSKALLSDVTTALDIINNAFDKCRTFIGYRESVITCPTLKIGEITVDNEVNAIKVYPNPFSDKVTFEFVSQKDAHAILEIRNVLGQKVATLMDKQIKEGIQYKVEYQPENVISGILFYRLILDNAIQDGSILYKK